MPSITFSVSDQAVLDQLTQAACALYGYQQQIPDPQNPGQAMPNPLSPQQFAQQVIVNYCKELVKAYSAQQAAEQARQAALQQAGQALSNVQIDVSTSTAGT